MMGKVKLYVRFPCRIEEELQVKNLCSLIESVHLPRQKSARWCIVDFKTSDIRKEAIKILKSVLIDNKRLVIKPVKSKPKHPTLKKSDCVDTVQDLLKV